MSRNKDRPSTLSCSRKFTFSQPLDYKENIPTVTKSMTYLIRVCQVLQKIGTQCVPKQSIAMLTGDEANMKGSI